MKVEVHFYGVLKELVQTGPVEIEGIKNTETLIHRIMTDYPEIRDYKFNISVNNCFVYSNTDLKDGDEIALVPPFEGG